MYLLTHLLIRTLVLEFNHLLPWSGHVSGAAKISQIAIFRVACGSYLKQRCHTTHHKRVDLPRLYSTWEGAECGVARWKASNPLFPAAPVAGVGAGRVLKLCTVSTLSRW